MERLGSQRVSPGASRRLQTGYGEVIGIGETRSRTFITRSCSFPVSFRLTIVAALNIDHHLKRPNSYPAAPKAALKGALFLSKAPADLSLIGVHTDTKVMYAHSNALETVRTRQADLMPKASRDGVLQSRGTEQHNASGRIKYGPMPILNAVHIRFRQVINRNRSGYLTCDGICNFNSQIGI